MDEAGFLRWISIVVLHSDGYQAGIGHLGHHGICNRMTRDEMSSRLKRSFCM
jgi:hypothetical protein